VTTGATGRRATRKTPEKHPRNHPFRHLPDRCAPSYENTAVCVPATPAAVTATPRATLSPAVSWHTTDDADAHDAVPHADKPTRADGVVPRVPKPIPDTVTPKPAVPGRFGSAMKLTVGAANEAGSPYTHKHSVAQRHCARTEGGAGELQR